MQEVNVTWTESHIHSDSKNSSGFFFKLWIFQFLLCIFLSKVGNTTHCMELRFVTVIGNLSKGHGENTKHNFVIAFSLAQNQ